MTHGVGSGRLRQQRDEFTERLKRGDTYGLLLGLLMLTYVLIALLERSPWERFIIAMMLGLVFLLTLHTSHVRNRAYRVCLGIVLIIEAATLVQAIIGREGNDGSGYIMFMFLLIAPIVILARILRHEVISRETILGALCVYVLLGIAFAGIYAAINDFEPLGFFAQPGPKTNVDFLYFSFITQTTVGYGDLTPGPDIGRVVTTFEALIGQVFLVTLVARLVSLYGRRAHESTDVEEA
ncbi:MAG TPA: ion channel [Acidimicrobiia bacterium]|nr:ion channel [Acidimicrobiia bacterium]